MKLWVIASALLFPGLSFGANNCVHLLAPPVDNGTLKSKVCEDDHGNMNFRDLTTGAMPVNLSSLVSGGDSPTDPSFNSVKVTNNICVGGAIKSAGNFITTAQGNLDASTLINQLPAISGAQLYALNAQALNGPIPAASLAGTILNQNALQPGSTFYVSDGIIDGDLVVNGNRTSTTTIYATQGNIGFGYGNGIIVSPSNSWPSGTHYLVNIFFNSVDDEADYYTPGSARSTPVLTMRSGTGNVGVGTTNPQSKLDVVGGVAASTYMQIGALTKANIALTTPSQLGQEYFCTDCTTVPVCISTSTLPGSFSLITNRGSPCQ